MRTILIIIALICIISWIVGTMWYALTGLFNLVIIIGILFFIWAILSKPKKSEG